MSYVSLILSEEAAPACIRELGVLGCMQFTDLNPELTPFQRRFVSYIKRCDEIERKIRYLNGEVKKMGVPMQPAGSVDAFVESINGQEQSTSAFLLESLETKLGAFESQLFDLNKYSAKLSEEYCHKVSVYMSVCVVEGVYPPCVCRSSTTISCASLASFWARSSRSSAPSPRSAARPTRRSSCR